MMDSLSWLFLSFLKSQPNHGLAGVLASAAAISSSCHVTHKDSSNCAWLIGLTLLDERCELMALVVVDAPHETPG